MTKGEILSFLKAKKPFLRKHFCIEDIGLFGSFARDEATDESDIDFVIITSKKSFRNRYRLKEYLEKEFNRSVDIGYLDSLRTYIKNAIEDEIIYV